MHVGGVLIFDGEITRQEIVRRLRERIHLIPRYAMRLDEAPLGSANPVWVEDEHFRTMRWSTASRPCMCRRWCSIRPQRRSRSTLRTQSLRPNGCAAFRMGRRAQPIAPRRSRA
jgi:hypothetical protein